jgi:quinol monooxygenase YgiN
VLAKTGQHDATVGILLEAARLLTPLAGCLMYVVNVVPAEPDAVWVTEIWSSEADHDALLKMDSVMALLAKARPLIAGFESVRLVPVGGKGLPAA